jgi:hypothetical protein
MSRRLHPKSLTRFQPRRRWISNQAGNRGEPTDLGYVQPRIAATNAPADYRLSTLNCPANAVPNDPRSPRWTVYTTSEIA